MEYPIQHQEGIISNMVRLYVHLYIDWYPQAMFATEQACRSRFFVFEKPTCLISQMTVLAKVLQYSYILHIFGIFGTQYWVLSTYVYTYVST